MDIMFMMALMKNLNVGPPKMLLEIFKLFDISHIFTGPYYYESVTNY
jgi:hypothetical protein